MRSVVDWVDEVIVVDSGSTDRTCEIAAAAGANVSHNDWPGYGEQKRHAEDLCRNDWLLNIDADEEITHTLRDEIVALFDPLPDTDICKFEILDIFPHEAHAKSWGYGYWQYRLYDRHKGRFSDSSVHDTVRPLPDARIQTLKGKVNHRSMRSLSISVEKMNRISSMQRDDMLKRGRKISLWRVLTEFPLAFLKGYFLRRQFIYGFWGIVLAYNYAFSRFLRVAKMYEAELIEKNNSE
ncbi:glycosyltransferase family 2 protein [Cohaesibacter sp. ES.047]|uniref:glycosyltransferase family 2 protein n=1 Tax=Cohaesibacter sp. ES.047 TaxID=1798205 RepID=UPI001FCE45AF|nr:glycosyltransferase family 2 protein [Cohaesibacter sp. ES.047]